MKALISLILSTALLSGCSLFDTSKAYLATSKSKEMAMQIMPLAPESPKMSKAEPPEVIDFSLRPFPPEIEEIVEEIIEFPEVDPSFPGGMTSLYEYLQGTIQYPEMCQEMAIQGRVYVQFNVMKDGSIDEVTVVRGVHESLDREAIRAIKTMPKWQPAEARGRKLSKTVVIPVNFTLR